MEYDIGGNHVLKNATALAFAGAVLPSSGLLPVALSRLRRELTRQVLADGGHEERSTSYHRAVLEDLDDVAELARRCAGGVPEWLQATADRMRGWLEEIAGPNRLLPLLNDAWEGPPIGGARRRSVTHLEGTGHVVLRDGEDQLLFDAGPLCPPHLPAHAHADALSFVLWADGRPVIVDPGSHSYSCSSRDEYRGTAAHSTVAVEGEDQCVFWGDFRAARLPDVAPARVHREDGLVVVSSRHDGYRRLRDPATHERAVAWAPGVGVVVLDRLLGSGDHRVRSRLTLAPGVQPEGGRVGPFVVAAVGEQPGYAVSGSSYSPYLGSSLPTATLVHATAAVPPGQVFGWSLLRPGTRLVEASAESLVLEGADGTVRCAPLAD